MAQAVIGCGHALLGQELLIVDPETLKRCPPNQVGEIWLKGPSVAQGYWNLPEESAQTFQGFLKDTGEGPYLRTGDLGFQLDGELFITGRIKDLIIIRGRNLYPQDIETSVEQSDALLRAAPCAAFSVEVDNDEKLVILQELDSGQLASSEALARGIRRAVVAAHDIQPHAVVFIGSGELPKTASGKIQRQACRKMYLAGTLNVLAASLVDAPAIQPPRRAEIPEDPIPAQAAPTQESLRDKSRAARAELLTAYLQSLIARNLKVPPSQVDAQQPLTVLGLDSILAIELAEEMETNLGINLPMATLLQGASIAECVNVLLDAQAAQTADPEEKNSDPGHAWDTHPLTYGQRALWFLQKLEPDHIGHNLVYGLRVCCELDLPVFKEAYARLFERHPVLRSTFIESDAEPLQVVHEHIEPHLEIVDATTWDEAAIKRRLEMEVYRPFDLEKGPLVRLIEIDVAPDNHLFVLAQHHIVTDMWSIALLVHDLFDELYPAIQAGAEPTIKPLEGSYRDYANWQRELLSGPEGEALWSFWKEQLSGDLPVLDLPTDKPRTGKQTGRGAAQSIRLPLELSRALHNLSVEAGANLFSTVLAAFEVLLHRYTGQTDILVGTPKFNRNRQTARIAGYFINPIVLRADLRDNPGFTTFLKQVHQNAQAAFEHDAYPFSLLVERLHPVRDLNRSPVFQVMFSWQKTTRLIDSQIMTALAMGDKVIRFEKAGLSMETLPIDQRVAPFDLTLLMAEGEEDLALTIEYNVDLFEPATIRRMLTHLQTLLEAILANPDEKIGNLSILPAAEREQLLVEWNNTHAGEPTRRCIHQWIEEQVKRTPDAVAVTEGQDCLTYAALNRRANQIAHFLHEADLEPETAIGVCLERSLDLASALLGILKAGGAYLPLDPAYPKERLAYMLKDACVPILFTHKAFVEQLPASSAQTVCLDTDWETTFAQEGDRDLLASVGPASLAYIIYTSGSTGKPKGVLVPHAAIANHCLVMRQYYQTTPADKVLEFASPVFDASLEQILVTLLAGATLVMRDADIWPPADLSGKIAELGLTVLNIPPAYWHQWAEEDARASAPVANDQLRLVIIGGDVIHAESLAYWRQTPMKHARLINAYGPTETTITATTFEIPQDFRPGKTSSSVPIGRPLPNRTVYILDGYGNPMPAGYYGELHIGGAGLARGYLNQPELSAQKFVRSPFSREPETCLYKTGDLARYLPDGNIEFVGRIDRQVKLRGFRIELGEIEALLKQHPQVKDAVVLLRGEGAAARLVAYLVPIEGQTPDPGEIQVFLGRQLPTYMLPSNYVLLEALPLTPGGKIDRQALPLSNLASSGAARQHTPPRNPVEQELSELWARVLHVDQVGIYDNFFDLGGHSLLATQLISRLREAYQVDLPVRRLFEAPTVAGVASLIVQELAKQEDGQEVAELLDEIEQLSENEVQSLLDGDTPVS